MHNESTAKGDYVKLQRNLLTEADARAMLERIRWPNGVACLDCGSMNIGRIDTKPSTRSNGKPIPARHLYKCRDCKKQFSVTKGTIFEDSKIPLTTWITVMYRMCSSKRGISAFQIHREFGMNYEAAWYMCHRIRWAMTEKTFSPLSGIVEADETYVGGKPRGHAQTAYKGLTRGQRMKLNWDRKVPVFGIMERGGRVRAIAMRGINKASAQAMLRANIDTKNAMLITDEHPMYKGIVKDLPHGVIRHASEYVRGAVHTQSIESFWSIIKRGLVGTYYHVDEGYLNQYVQEFAYRHNTRKIPDAERFTSLLGQVEGRLEWYLTKPETDA